VLALLKTYATNLRIIRLCVSTRRKHSHCCGSHARARRAGPHASVVAGNGAFDLPPLSGHPVDKPPRHLAPIPGVRPIPLAPWVERDHRRPDRPRGTAPAVVLGVIGRIRHDTVPRRVSGGLANGGWELGRILGRAPTDHAPGHQVGVGVDHQRPCRPASAGNASRASAPDIVAADMPGFQARGINDPSRARRQQFKGLRPLPQSARSGAEAWLPQQTLMRVTQGGIVRHVR
jgi:hypothetical protein